MKGLQKMFVANVYLKKLHSDFKDLLHPNDFFNYIFSAHFWSTLVYCNVEEEWTKLILRNHKKKTYDNKKLESQNLIAEEMKTSYLGHCYRKDEAGKCGEYHTHHHNRSPSKEKKISNSNNVQDQQFLLYSANFAVPVPFIYSFSKKLHFPISISQMFAYSKEEHCKTGLLFLNKGVRHF